MSSGILLASMKLRGSFMDKIMILGASVYQVPLIKTAKRMGLYTIVSSMPGAYPGFDYADKAYYINTVDKEAILEICRKEGVNGICTSGTDVAVATIGYVNDQMGLSGISEIAADKACDKFQMKEAFAEGSVAASRYVRVTSLEEAYAAAEQIGYPVVVKCVDSSGSRGINVIDTREEMSAAYEEAVRYSRKDYVLIESKLGGHEIGVDGMVENGELILLAPHEKFTYKFRGATMPAGHAFPYKCSDKVYDEIAKQITLATRSLGIDNTAFNSDVFVDGDEVYIIEMGGRAGATCIPELISIYYGFDFYEQMINNALGRPVVMPEGDVRVPCMAKLLMSPVDGTISYIDEEKLDAIRGEGITVRLDYGVGDSIEKMYNGTTRIGHVIAAVDDEDEFDRIKDRVYSAMFVDGRSLEELWRD